LKTQSALLFLLVVALSFAYPAETKTDALSADLARYYFASPEAEAAARLDLDFALKGVGKFKGQINTGSSLVHGLQAYEEVLKLYRHHAAYLRLRCSLNRKDSACDANRKLGSEVSAKTAFLIPEILAISNQRLPTFYTAEPRLKTYRFAIEEIFRDAGHVLPEDKQALLDRFQPEIADWQYDLYEQILAGIPFGAVQTAAGPLDVVRQRSLLASNSDAHVREDAFKRRFNGFASQRDLLAFALIYTVKAQDALAKAHHHQDAPARKYSSLYLDSVQTRALLDLMAQHGEVAKRFEKIRARDFQEAYKVPMQAWDLSAPQPGFIPPITFLADTPQLFNQAFAGLGAEYQAAFGAVLDPRNGRADVLPGGAPNRYTGGFSLGFP
jgi:oligoendopeptidase F